jgi:hypothetical protein
MPMIYGLLAKFDTSDELTVAATKLRETGFTKVEAFSPYPLPEVAAALGHHRSGVAFLVLLGGLAGGLAAFAMLWWTQAVSYPWNAGGRPPNSWPMFIPVTFELTILTAAMAAFLGVFILCGLPRYHHPLFGASLFLQATSDGFYLCIRADDPRFEREETRHLLEELHAIAVAEVEP